MKRLFNKCFYILSLTAVLLLPLLFRTTQAAGSEYQTMLSRLSVLEQLAQSYIAAATTGTSADQLMFSYIRSQRYGGTAWNTLAGEVDSGFITYVEENSPDTAKLRSMGSITLPNDDTTDAVHMFAAMNMILTGNGDLGGWIGDTCQLVQDIQYESGTADELIDKAKAHFLINGHFARQDWIADMDGYNLMQSKRSDESWTDCLSRYFSPVLTEKQRVSRFIRSNLGDSYSSETATRDDYRSLVKKRYNVLMIKVLQISIFGSSIPAQKYHDAACYAVADYMYDAMCATVPDSSTVSFDYKNETLRLASGLTANSLSNFSGKSYTNGDSIIPGEQFYVKGYRDVENGSFFPSATVLINVPKRPDAPAAPEPAAVGADSISFPAEDSLQYSIDDGLTWQDDSVLSELLPNSEYRVICRRKAGETSFRSDASPATEVQTALPQELLVNSHGVFYPADGQVSVMLLAEYDENGRMTTLTSADDRNGVLSCSAPQSTAARTCIFILDSNTLPILAEDIVFTHRL